MKTYGIVKESKECPGFLWFEIDGLLKKGFYLMPTGEKIKAFSDLPPEGVRAYWEDSDKNYGLHKVKEV